MRVDITTTNDENFTLYVNGVENTPVPRDSAVEDYTAQDHVVEKIQPIEETTEVVKDKSPNPVPIENEKTNRLSFFDGTSWDDGVRGHKF